MNEDTLEKLRDRFGLVTQAEIDALKGRLALTIQILQSFLDKPEGVRMDITLNEDETAVLETYKYKESPLGGITLDGGYTSIDLDYEYAEALRDFLERAKIGKYGNFEYPKIGTPELIKEKIEKRLAQIEINRKWDEKERQTLENALKELGHE